MPSAVRQQLVQLTSELPNEPTDTDLSALVKLLADVASRAPKRAAASVMALLRHGAPESLPGAVRQRLAELAVLEVRARRGRPSSSQGEHQPVLGSWFSLAHAAARLELREDTLNRRLDRPENRRRYGYPRWDGYQWWLSSPMVEPETSATFLAALPDREPLEELLPDWCIREGHTKAPRDAETDEERVALRRRGPLPQRGA